MIPIYDFIYGSIIFIECIDITIVPKCLPFVYILVKLVLTSTDFYDLPPDNNEVKLSDTSSSIIQNLSYSVPLLNILFISLFACEPYLKYVFYDVYNSTGLFSAMFLYCFIYTFYTNYLL